MAMVVNGCWMLSVSNYGTRVHIVSVGMEEFEDACGLLQGPQQLPRMLSRIAI